MDDLISRQAAISAICNACGKIDCDKMDKCEKLQLPPANCSEIPNNSDLISRQAAIDALRVAYWDDNIQSAKDDPCIVDAMTDWAIRQVKALPHAQPEQLGTNLAEVGTRAVRGYPIDADALMEKVAEEYGERARDRLYQIIRYMPPAQPETTTVTIGRTRGGITMWYKCDACDEPVDQNDNYCRNCGRKLKHE